MMRLTTTGVPSIGVLHLTIIVEPVLCSIHYRTRDVLRGILLLYKLARFLHFT